MPNRAVNSDPARQCGLQHKGLMSEPRFGIELN